MSSGCTENPNPIVIDNGSGVIKAGFAGDEAPHAVFPTIVAHRQHLSPSSYTDPAHCYIGRGAQTKRDVFGIHYPMSTASSPTGTTWRKSGSTHSTTNCVSHPKIMRCCSPSRRTIRQVIGRRWRKCSLSTSTCPVRRALSLSFRQHSVFLSDV